MRSVAMVALIVILILCALLIALPWNGNALNAVCLRDWPPCGLLSRGRRSNSERDHVAHLRFGTELKVVGVLEVCFLD